VVFFSSRKTKEVGQEKNQPLVVRPENFSTNFLSLWQSQPKNFKSKKFTANFAAYPLTKFFTRIPKFSKKNKKTQAICQLTNFSVQQALQQISAQRIKF